MTTISDHDALRSFWGLARLAQNPIVQQRSRELKAAKVAQRKPEWGRPIDQYIADLGNPNYNTPAPTKSLVQTALDSVQPIKRELLRPTCETFRIILGLLRDPVNLPMLDGTTVLPSCIHLLREHLKDTEEPVLCYEYGYLCFQVLVLAIQVSTLCTAGTDGFDSFMQLIRKGASAQDIPTTLSLSTMLHLHLQNHDHPGEGSDRVFQVSRSAQGKTVVLSSAGGMTERDGTFLVKALWESRKQMSHILSKAALPGWVFLFRIVLDLLFGDISRARLDPLTWGFLDNLCHRYGLYATEEDIDIVAETSTMAGALCPEDHYRERAHSMVDVNDARTLVEAYNNRMTSTPLLPLSFCSTLVDVIVREDVCFLGEEMLVKLIRVSYERAWMELGDEMVRRDADWSQNMARIVINTMGSTERLFAAEHRFKPAQIEAFVPPLYDIDVIGFLGQALLLPTLLPPEQEVDSSWSTLIQRVISFAETLSYSKSSALAAKLFVENHSDWLHMLYYIRQQILNNPHKDESLRGNAQGAELAWTSVGRVFNFTDPTKEKRKGTEMVCLNSRCPKAEGIDVVAVCGRCLQARYCSRMCQNTHWRLKTADAHRLACVRAR
ncbi:hypothetical protein FRC12_011974 [Ceratobasidium sp. 428]|nr:hypothetical protein FRC12_011974 [Ceratobasidium sp. 428]